MVGVESHAAVALERAARARRIDAHPCQVGFAQSPRRIGLDRSEQPLDYLWRLASLVQGPAA